MDTNFNAALYQEEMLSLVNTAIKKLKAEHPDYTVFTISLTTDFASGVSAVHFDSRASSERYLKNEAEQYQKYLQAGMDQMNQALLRGYLVILVAQLIFSLLRLWIPARICESLLWVLMVFILFRMFSKNLTKRRAENQKFMGWIWKARNNAAGAKARRADKEHKYFTCRCGAICRVPVGKGKIVITCPKCGAKIEAKS